MTRRDHGSETRVKKEERKREIEKKKIRVRPMGMLNEQHANSERNEPGPFPFQFHWSDKLKEIMNCSNALDRRMKIYFSFFITNKD